MAKERFKLVPAVYLILRQGEKILLLRRANTGYQDGKYSVVAGHLDGDELAREALAREAKEEANIEINPSDLRLVHTAHRLSRGESDQERVDLFFEADKWQGEVKNMEPNKCDDLSWFPVEQLPSETMPFIRLVLENIFQEEPYSEYLTEP